MKKLVTLSVCLILTGILTLQAQQRVITQQNNTNKKKLTELAEKLSIKYAKQRAEAERIAKDKGWFIRKDTDSIIMELQYVDPFGMPQYFTTHNLNAARTINTDDLWVGGSSGYNLTGAGFTAGEWDGGGVLTTHQEFDGRVTQMDTPGSTHFHSTHVAGTIVAQGQNAAAQGGAYEANLNAWDWNNDVSEMATAAAGGLTVANASYGWTRGWIYNSPDLYWYGNTSISSTEDYLFGFYDASSQDLDQIAFDAPGFLLCKSAGNDRNDSYSGGHYVWGGSSWVCSTDSRDPDGGSDGYDCIDQKGVAKNVLTVGAVDDIPGGYTIPADVVMSSFSSWGPTDDGRIKPDIVANGVGVYSTGDGSTSSYIYLDGTSMSTPSVTGTLALLQDYYESLNMGYMSAAALKGLAINTANEAGAANGPDYIYGWGLMNATGAADLMAFDNADGGLIVEAILQNGQTTEYTYYCNGANDINVTICWTDVPGTPPAASLNPTTLMLVNDLDLRIISSGGYTYSPWKLNPASPSSNAYKGDNFRDNVETVNIQFPAAGYYTIRINHKGTLTNSEQAFAMIVSGMETPAPLTFCNAHSTNDYEYIQNVTVAGINQTSGLAPGGFSDYTGLVANMDKGTSYPITVTLGSAFSGDDGYAWADWNQDGDFDDTGEAFVLGSGLGPYNGTITVPPNANAGYTTLRIRINDTWGQNYCGVSTWGETEDYTISVAGTPGLWTGAVSTDWTNPANWDDNNVPTATVDVVIPSGTPFSPHIAGGSTANCGNLDIQSGAHLYQDGTSACYFYVYGNFNSDLGTFTQSGTAYLYLAGSANTYWDDDNLDDTYTSVRVLKSTPSASLSLWQGMTVSETFQVREGRLVIDNNWALTVTGTGTTAFRVESGGTLVLTNSQSLLVAGAVIFQDGSQAEVTGGTITCGTDFTVSENTAYDIQFTGGSVIMNGTGTQFLNISDANTQFYNLTINKPSGTCTVNYNNLDVNGNLTISGGTFNPNSLSVYVAGNWSNSVGPAGFNETGSRVIFDAVGHNYILTDETFDILEANMTAALRPGSNTVTCNVYDWTSGGIDVFDGTFTALDLTDNGISGGFWLNPGGTINLTNSSTGWVDLNGDIHIFGGTMNVYGSVSYWPYGNDASIQMTGGVLDFPNCGILINNTSLYALSSNITGGTIRTAYGYTSNRADFSPAGGTLELYGLTDAQISQVTGSTLSNLVINKEAVSLSPGAPPAGPIIDPHSKKIILDGTKTSISSLSSDVTLTGNLTIASGTLYLAGHTLNVEHDCDVYGTLQLWNPADVLNVGTVGFDNLSIKSGGWADFQAGAVNLASWVVVDFGADLECYVPNTLNFTGGGVSGIQMDDNSPLNRFGHVNIVSTNPTYLFSNSGYDIVVDGNMTIQAGNSLDMQDESLVVHGLLTDDPTSTVYVYNGPVKGSAGDYMTAAGSTGGGTSGSKGGSLEVYQDFTVQGLLDVGDGNVMLHANFGTASTGILTINGGSVVADQPNAKTPDQVKAMPSKDSKGWKLLNGTLNMSYGLLEFTNNSIQFGTAAVNNISGGVIRCGEGFSSGSSPSVFEPTGGSVEFTGTVPNGNIYCFPGNSFFVINVVLNSGNTIHYMTDVTVRSDIYLQDGTLQCGNAVTDNYSLSVGGSWFQTTSGYFAPGEGTVFFYGDGNYHEVDADIHFYDLVQTDEPNGNTIDFTNNVTVDHNMTLNNSASFINNLTVYGLLDLSNPASSLSAMGSANGDIAKLSQGGTLNVDILGSLTISDLVEDGIFGTINISGGELNLYQDAIQYCDINGNLSITNGTVNLYGAGSSYFSYSGNASLTMSGGVLDFHDLSVVQIATGYTFSENITGGLIRTANTLSLQTPDFSPTGGMVEMYGATDAPLQAISGANLHDLSINKSGGDKSEIIYTDRDDNIIKSTKANSVSILNALLVNGNMSVDAGNLNVSNSTIVCTGNFDVNSGGTFNIGENGILDMGNLKTLAVKNGGSINVLGQPGLPATLTSSGGYYSFNVESGATIGAHEAVFESMFTNGIYLQNGSLVDPVNSFNLCVFREGISGGRMLTIHNNQLFTVTDAVFPTNTWGGAYNVYKSTNVGEVTFIGATGGFEGTAYEYDPYSRVHWTDHILSLDLVVQLEGPFNGTSMNNYLNNQALLPLSQPYNTAPWNYTGTETVAAIPNSQVIDWVLVEGRDAPNAASATAATTFERQAAFILADGSVVGMDGGSAIQFTHNLNEQLFVVIRHRNHLDIMSSTGITQSAGVYSYDFSTGVGQAYGSNAIKDLGGGIYGLFGGDGDANGIIGANDKTAAWEIEAGTGGYLQGDYNLDSQTDNKDKNDILFNNTGNSSQIPL